MKKNLIVIAAACTILVGCQEGHRAPNHYYGEMTYREYKTQEKQQEPKYTQLPNDQLAKTVKEFDGYTLYEHIDNRINTPRDGFGALYIKKNKETTPRDLSTFLVVKYPGARTIKAYKLIINGEAYQCCPQSCRKVSGGRILAYNNHHMTADSFMKPLAMCESARLLVIFNNGQKEFNLTKEDLKNFSGIVQTYLSMGGMTNS